MGKTFNAMILGVIISIALAFFNGAGLNPTSLVLILLDPSSWQNASFWQMFAALGAIGGGILIIGLGAVIKQDWVWRAGIITSLSSIILSPYVDFFQFINSQTSYISSNCFDAPICSVLNNVGGIGQWIGILIVGPIFLWALWSCVEYVFKGDSF